MNGFPDTTIDISDAELEVTLQKACVGTGLNLGTGIELARAALTMRHAGIDPAAVFEIALRHFDTNETGEFGDYISAISDGPSVCDGFIAKTASVSRISVDCPLIVLAILAARGCSGRLAMADSDGDAIFGSYTFALEGGALSGALAPNTLELRQEPAANVLADDRGGRDVCAVDAASWREICALANRCLVSGSEESRLNDAGAGLVDED